MEGLDGLFSTTSDAERPAGEGKSGIGGRSQLTVHSVVSHAVRGGGAVIVCGFRNGCVSVHRMRTDTQSALDAAHRGAGLCTEPSAATAAAATSIPDVWTRVMPASVMPAPAQLVVTLEAAVRAGSAPAQVTLLNPDAASRAALLRVLAMSDSASVLTVRCSTNGSTQLTHDTVRTRVGDSPCLITAASLQPARVDTPPMQRVYTPLAQQIARSAASWPLATLALSPDGCAQLRMGSLEVPRSVLGASQGSPPSANAADALVQPVAQSAAGQSASKRAQHASAHAVRSQQLGINNAGASNTTAAAAAAAVVAAAEWDESASDSDSDADGDSVLQIEEVPGLNAACAARGSEVTHFLTLSEAEDPAMAGAHVYAITRECDDASTDSITNTASANAASLLSTHPVRRRKPSILTGPQQQQQKHALVYVRHTACEPAPSALCLPLRSSSANAASPTFTSTPAAAAAATDTPASDPAASDASAMDAAPSDTAAMDAAIELLPLRVPAPTAVAGRGVDTRSVDTCSVDSALSAWLRSYAAVPPSAVEADAAQRFYLEAVPSGERFDGASTSASVALETCAAQRAAGAESFAAGTGPARLGWVLWFEEQCLRSGQTAGYSRQINPADILPRRLF